MGTVHTLRSPALQVDAEELAALRDMEAAEGKGEAFPFPYEREKRAPIWRLYDRCLICMIVRDDEAPALAFTLTTLARAILRNH